MSTTVPRRHSVDTTELDRGPTEIPVAAPRWGTAMLRARRSAYAAFAFLARLRNRRLAGFALLATAVGAFAIMRSGGSDSSSPMLEQLAAKQLQLGADLRRLETEVASLRERLAPERDDSPIRPQVFTPAASERDDPFFGSRAAPVLVEVFSDFGCAVCRKFHRDVVSKLREKHGKSDLVRVVYRDFPLQANAISRRAATFAHCAGEQSAYWQAFELLSAGDTSLSLDSITQLSTKLDRVDRARLSQCASSDRYEAEIDADAADALSIGAKGAPSTFIGLRSGDSFRGVFIRGAQPLAVLEQEIERLLGLASSVPAGSH